MEDALKTKQRQHHAGRVEKLYPDGPERPIVLHYVRNEDIGRDMVTLCGETIPARHVALEAGIKSNRPRVVCPFCELIMQTYGDGGDGHEG